MADNSRIEWTDATLNPIRARRRDNGKVGFHCEHVSEACRNCYAEAMNRRGLWTGLEYKPGNRDKIEIFLDEATLLKPLRWKKPRKIFMCSMTDLFADFVTDEMIDRIFAVMALCPQHTFQVLTKRPARMREYFDARMMRPARDRISSIAYPLSCRFGVASMSPVWPLPNVWLGTTVEDRAALKRIDHLRAVPARVRFLSIEPLLEDLGEIDLTGIHWVIVGGESGPGARPMHPQWARDLRDQCKAAGVAFNFKQWGEWAPSIGKSVTHRFRKTGQFEECNSGPLQTGEPGMRRVGKARAGRLLDGEEWSQFPEPRA